MQESRSSVPRITTGITPAASLNRAYVHSCLRFPFVASSLRRFVACLFVPACLLIAAGCGQPTVDMYDAQDGPPAAATGTNYTDADWATVLRENVKDDLVDYRHLATHAEPLNRYIDLVRRIGPRTTPDHFRQPNAALAYYINVHNACVLSAVVRAGVPVTMYDLQLPRLEDGYRFFIDGQPRTLADLHTLARQSADGDARVELALSSAALGTPPLANEPYRAVDVRNRLRELGEQAVSNPRLVRVDHEQQQLLVALPIMSQRDAFEETYKRETASSSGTMLNCLMHLAGSHQRAYLARATGYDVRVMPFDRNLNIWRPQRAG
jgi:hypothetical protein